MILPFQHIKVEVGRRKDGIGYGFQVVTEHRDVLFACPDSWPTVEEAFEAARELLPGLREGLDEMGLGHKLTSFRRPCSAEQEPQ